MSHKALWLFWTSLLLTGVNVSAQPYGWSQLPNSPSDSARYDDVYFVNASAGWAAGGRDGIYRTTNGGNTWAKVLTNSSTHFRCIGFASATRGWAGNLGPGSYDGGVTDTNVMYQTFDGGLNWSVVPGINQTGMKGFCAMHILDSQHIYGGGRVRGPAYFVKSTNGGANWMVTNLTAAGVMGGIMDVYFKDTTNGFVVGMDTNAFTAGCPSAYHGRIAKTTDGGNTWTPVVTTTVNCCYFWKMSWPTPDVGYVSLQKNPTSSDSIVFYKTTDGGNTWVPNEIPVSSVGISSFYWQAIGFVNASEGWAGGDGNTSPYANNFLHTIDGGASWTPVGYNDSRRINRIRFLSPILGFASGVKVHIFRQPLAITFQPQNQLVVGGTNVSFSVGVDGDPPFKYQWRKNGVTLPGATNATLTLTSVARAQTGTYVVGVTNAAAGLLSSNALLRVLVPQFLQAPILVPGSGVRLLFGDADQAPLTTNYLANFDVHASTNLVNWAKLTNALSLTNGLLLLVDPAVYPQRFYRVVEH